MPVVSNIKLKLLGVVKLNLYIKVICLLCASLMATHALSQDMSGWSDKTVCRLVESNGGAEYLEEAASRGVNCKAPIKAKPVKPAKSKYSSSTKIDRFGGISEIPESANPNYETLKFYLYRYLYSFNIYPFCRPQSKEFHCKNSPPLYSHQVKASNDPYHFQSDLREDEYIKKQMQKTALLSYLLYEDGKIVIDEITPKDRFGDMFTNSSRYHSQSMGKTLVSYVAGHAICKGYIKSIDSRLDDWAILENTLYHNQKLIDLLNMTAGDQNYVNRSNKFSNSNRFITSPSINDIMENELKGSKKSHTKYNYNNLPPILVMSYILHKAGDEGFQQLLNEVFTQKARISGKAFFLKGDSTAKDDVSVWNQFYATRYDYLRIAKAMLDDWKNDTCVGKYLKTVHSLAVKKSRKVKHRDSRVRMPKGYAGFFHTNFKGMSNRKVMSMDGAGGQSIIIDFERERIVAIQAIHDNMKFPKAGSFNWKKIAYDTIRNGRPASNSTIDVTQPLKAVIDPQQLIVERESNQEAQRVAKEYWDNYYDALDEVINLEANRVLFGSSADGSIMFSEDFEIEAQRAIRVDERDNKWSIKQDKGGNSVYCNKVSDHWTEFNFGSAQWSDYSIAYRMKFSAGKGGSAETHIRKTNNGEYRANIGSYGGIEIQFVKRPERIPKNLARGFVSTKTGQWLDVQISASGENITYLIDGEVVASAKDNRAKKGFGFFAVSANSEVCIDDIVVNKM